MRVMAGTSRTSRTSEDSRAKSSSPRQKVKYCFFSGEGAWLFLRRVCTGNPYDFIRVFPGGGKPEKKYSVRVRFLRTGKIPEAAGMKAE
jgi:hypothetical protein